MKVLPKHQPRDRAAWILLEVILGAALGALSVVVFFGASASNMALLYGVVVAFLTGLTLMNSGWKPGGLNLEDFGSILVSTFGTALLVFSVLFAFVKAVVLIKPHAP